MQQLVAQLPWGHNLRLLEAVKRPEERIWYARQAIEYCWSRAGLAHQIESRLFERAGRPPTKFAKTLPGPQSDLAHELLKDPYDFEFLAAVVEISERELERGLLDDLRALLLELGNCFAFVGSQYHLDVEDQECYLDLLYGHPDPGPWRSCTPLPVRREALLDLMFNMDRTWLEARRRVAGRRSNSRAPLALDMMAATPLISATTLAGAIGMSIKNAGMLLERFSAESVAVEVTHRSARRLFGLSGLAPLRDAVRPPKRPEPGRRRGRPPFLIEAPDPEPLSAPLPPVFERPAIDYSALEAAMAFADQTIRHSRHRLAALRTGIGQPRGYDPSGLAETGLEPGDCDV